MADASPGAMRRSLAQRFLLLERAADFAVILNGTAIANEGDDSADDSAP